MMNDEKNTFLLLSAKWVRVYFASFLLFFGIIYALLIPPFQSPDEPNHFFRAWQVSEGDLFPEKSGQRLGGILPASLSQVSDSFAYLKNNPAARLNARTWGHAVAIPLQPENQRFTDFANTAIYAPTAYLPQALAIAVLRPFHVSPLLILYATRLANLLLWILLVSAAIRLMPFMQTLLAAIAMLPATICIAASANADVLTNGLAWCLTVALLFSPISTAFLKKLLATLIIASNKLIAVVLIFAALFSVGKKLPGRVESYSGSFRKRFAILLAVGIISAMLWGRLAQSWFIPYDDYDPAFRDTQTLNSGVNPSRQLAFILDKPLFFTAVVCKSMVKALPSMAAHVVGKFGWEKNYLPAPWILLLWLMLGALLCSEPNPLPSRKRWGLLAITAMYVAAFAITMYLLWSAVGADKMDNWQGRYFLPVAPVLMLALAQGRLKKWKKEINALAFVILLLSNLAMVWSIWERYYWG